jgi:hypothetical protein
VALADIRAMRKPISRRIGVDNITNTSEFRE